VEVRGGRLEENITSGIDQDGGQGAPSGLLDSAP